jgi:hypothetical protein
MTRLAAIAALSLVVFSVSIEAQWPSGPAAGVAKKPGNLPAERAPVPRTAAGTPDLSGVWEPEKNRPCPPEGCRDLKTGEQFFDIGWGLKGGLPYQPWAEDLVKKRIAENGINDPNARCLPTGIVRSHTFPLLKKIVQVPGLVIILNERNSLYRQIITDGRRPVPRDAELPSPMGFSTGKWEGDTLVVESTGFTDGLWLDQRGSPLTSSGRIIERFRRVTFGKLEIEITVDDPKAYTAAWTTKLNQFLVPDTELLDYVCLENEKDVQNFGAN